MTETAGLAENGKYDEALKKMDKFKINSYQVAIQMLYSNAALFLSKNWSILHQSYTCKKPAKTFETIMLGNLKIERKPSLVKTIFYFFSILYMLPFVCGCQHIRAFPAATYPNQYSPSYSNEGYTNENIFNRKLYSQEWKFNHYDTNSPPQLGLTLSGGGERSANFSIGVLKGLYDSGILTNVDVISAVSGGSYALSWLYCQPYYHSAYFNTTNHDENAYATLNDMFQTDGDYLQFIQTSSANSHIVMDIITGAFFSPIIGALQRLAYRHIGNTRIEQVSDISPVKTAYRTMILGTYQSIPPTKKEPAPPSLSWGWHAWKAVNYLLPDGMNINYQNLADFSVANRLPDFIFNCTLDTVSTNHQPLGIWQKNFQFTPFCFGSDSYGFQKWTDVECTNYDIDSFNLSSAISGAVYCKQNMTQYRQFRWLLDFFYADLGYALDIPTNGNSILLSDGGHSENLGLYALVQRRCANIIVVDAEWEKSTNYIFEAYTNLQFALSNEMGLTLKVPYIDNNEFNSKFPVMLGKISGFKNPPSADLNLYYLKLSLDESHLTNYPSSIVHIKNDKHFSAVSRNFPQENTFHFHYSTNLVAALIDLGNYIVINSLITNLPSCYRHENLPHH